jgi:hypothetical protein
MKYELGFYAPEEGISDSYLCENLKFYALFFFHVCLVLSQLYVKPIYRGRFNVEEQLNPQKLIVAANIGAVKM